MDYLRALVYESYLLLSINALNLIKSTSTVQGERIMNIIIFLIIGHCRCGECKLIGVRIDADKSNKSRLTDSDAEIGRKPTQEEMEIRFLIFNKVMKLGE